MPPTVRNIVVYHLDGPRKTWVTCAMTEADARHEYDRWRANHGVYRRAMHLQRRYLYHHRWIDEAWWEALP